MLFNIIVAMCENNGIGINNKLPWNYKEELIHFSKTTKGNGNNAIIMGKNTWESLPKKPLPNRTHYILSSSFKEKTNPKYENCLFYNSLNDVLNDEKIKNNEFDECWFIGGAKLYDSIINEKFINKMVISFIPNKIECDTFFPSIPKHFNINTETIMVTKDDTKIKIVTYENNQNV